MLETLLRHVKNNVTSFHCPGHKNGNSIDRRIKKLGRKVFAMDVTVFKEVDSLHDPVGAIKYAQRLMAKAYGVRESLFLVNGTSVGNIAMLLGGLEQGDSVIISRIAHKSALSGVILAGLWPIWIDPNIERDFNIMLDANKENVSDMLKKFPEAKAVFLTSPTYNGVVTDLVNIVDIVHSANKLLLVDEAHGPHLKFNRNLPVSAIEAGADLCVQSIHKILSALSQGSVMHIISDRIDVAKMKKVVSMLQTTSPNYMILASIDAARHEVFFEGERIFNRIIKFHNYAAEEINKIENMKCLTSKDLPDGYELDPTKITVNVKNTGLTGYEVDDILANEFFIQVDASDIYNIIAIMGTGTTIKDVEKLIAALKKISQRYSRKKRRIELPELPPLTTEMVLLPRDIVFQYKSKRVPLRKSIGEISAQVLTPYPPGIPVLIPGERITKDVVEYIEELADLNIRISGQDSKELKTIKVVKVR